MATSSRDTATMNSLYTSTVEKWMGEGSVEEVIFSANQVIWLLSKVAKQMGTYGFRLVQPLMTTRNTGIGWFEYDDLLTIDSAPGPEAAQYDFAWLGGPLVITEQEEVENSDPHRRVHLLKFKYDQLMLSLAEEVNLSAIKGSSVNTKAMDGLLDIIYPHAAASADISSTADFTRAQAQTGTYNTYAGISRVTGGTTGWENYAATFGATSFTSLTGNPYKALERMYLYCSRGAIKPDIILSGLNPYLDIQRLMAGAAQYNREVDQFKNIQLGGDNIKFRNAVWLYDEACTGYSVGSASTKPFVAILNTAYMRLWVESGYDFAMSKFASPIDSRVSVAHNIWRGQLGALNPRYLAIMHNYGA